MDRIFLEAVLDAAGGASAVPAERPGTRYEAVASLVHGMEILEYVAGSWDLMLSGDDPDALRVVLRGCIAAVDLNPRRLAVEAAGMLKGLETVDLDAQLYRGLLSTLPRIPVEARWERAAEVGLPAEDLVRSLRHPSEVVAGNAAQLIASGAGALRAKDLIAGALEDAPQHTYEAVALLAPSVWTSGEALENLLSALEGGITARNRHLLGVDSTGERNSFRQCLSGGAVA